MENHILKAIHKMPDKIDLDYFNIIIEKNTFLWDRDLITSGRRTLKITCRYMQGEK
jgi:hypothetical protein